jgi:hypothetical protein
MKKLNVLIATLFLTSLSLLPAVASAEDLDDLEVTMEVVDNVEGIVDVVTEMPGPEFADGDSEDGRLDGSGDAAAAEGSGEGADEPVAGEDERFDRHEDEFFTDENFTEENDGFAEEGDFEESEEVDDDAYDIEMPEENDMDEDPMEDEVV